MTYIRQYEIYSPDIDMAVAVQDEEDKRKKYEQRDKTDREGLIEWLISEKGKSVGQANIIAKICFEDPNRLCGEDDVKLYFAEMRKASGVSINPRRQRAMDYVEAISPSYMLTLSFPYRLSDVEAFETVAFLLRKVNRLIWGRRWREVAGAGLDGVIVAEPHMRSTKKRGSLHFHILIRHNDAVAGSEALQNYVHDVLPLVTNKKGMQVLTPTLAQVKSVDNVKGLAVYLAKTMKYKDFANGDFLVPFTREGLVGVEYRSRQRVESF